MVNTPTNEIKLKQQLKLVAITFAVLVAILVAGYFAILRFNYANLYEGLREDNAAFIVGELDKHEVRYKLRNSGADIMVPANKVDAVRLSIISSGAATNGLVGFEIFNESQMGLTDFAQKIKYQRALQGELVRTILMMEGIENARVHIAVPERALFRGNQNVPKAAVTIISEAGAQIDATRIFGIQRLVAASVSELESSHVVVLNGTGEIISTQAQPNIGDQPVQDQVSKTYQEKAALALKALYPELFVELKVIPQQKQPFITVLDVPVPRLKNTSPNEKAFDYRIVLVTNQALSDVEKTKAKNILIKSLDFSQISGEQLHFEIQIAPSPITKPLPISVELIGAGVSDSAAMQKSAFQTPNANQGRNSSPRGKPFGSIWLLTGLFLLTALIAVVIYRRKQQVLSSAEQLNFAEQLKLKIQAYEEPSNA